MTCWLLTITAFAVLRFVSTQPEQSNLLFWGMVAGSAVLSGTALFFLSKPWSLDDLELSLLLATFTFIGALACTAFAQSLAGKPGEITILHAVIGALGLQAAALVLLPRFLRLHQIGWNEAFGVGLNWKTALLFGTLGAFIFLPVSKMLQFVSSDAMYRIGWKPEVQQAVQVLVNADAWYSRLIMGLVTIGLAPVAEEVLFRGILYPAVKRWYPRSALWIVSVLFGLVHFNLPTFLPLFVMGVMLTRLYETTGNLLAPITLHCLFNATNFFVLFFGQYLPNWVPFRP